MEINEPEPNLNIIRLSWPMFIEELTGGITSFFDILFLSMISDEAAASVGMLGPVIMLGFFILPQFTSAGTSVAAQYMGAKREDHVAPAWLANILISVTIGSLLALLLFIFHDRIGLWLGMTKEQNTYASEYLSIIALNFALVGIRFPYSSILASKTLTRWNMIASLITNLINIPLNWALMTGFWILPALGVRGIALATVIAYFIGFLFIFLAVHHGLKIHLLAKGTLKKAKETIIPIFRIGIPQALEPFSYTVQSIIVSYLIIRLGTAAMGANTYVQKFMFLDMAVSWSLTMGGQIVMSHHLGAGRISEVNESYWRIARIITSAAFIVFLVITIFRGFFLSFFTADAEIISLSSWLLLIALFMEPIRSINILGGIALKTVGDGKFSVILGLTFMWGLLPLIILASWLGLGIIGVWCCLLLDETVRAIINAWRWKSGRWRGKAVIGTA